MIERTLSLVKPDAVSKNKIGAVIARYEDASIRVIALRMLQLTPEQARSFYHVHKDRPFFEGLITFICSGPIVAMALEGEGAVLRVRALMGATHPDEAAEGTLRRDFGSNIEANAVHGSDSLQTAAFEVSFFFKDLM